MEKIKLKNVEAYYHKNNPILTIENLEINKGSFNVVLGKNGSGKSTFAKLLANLIKFKGEISLFGHNVHKISQNKLSKLITYINQINDQIFGVSVYDYVASGRNPYTNFIGILSKNDKKIIEEKLKALNIWDIKDKFLEELSGGQIQKVNICLGLVQETNIILIDEPTNHLDPRSMLSILKLIKDINIKENKTIILITHELYNGLKYADYIIMVKNKKIFKFGKANKIITKENIKNLFDVDCKVEKIDHQKVAISNLKLK